MKMTWLDPIGGGFHRAVGVTVPLEIIRAYENGDMEKFSRWMGGGKFCLKEWIENYEEMKRNEKSPHAT